MRKLILTPLLGAVALTAACEARIGDGEQAKAGMEASAEGKVEDGRVSIKAPGVDISVALPKDIRVNTASDSDLIYPGAAVGGINIDGSGDGAVRVRFNSGDAPALVNAWYQDAARTGFAIERAISEGGTFVLSGRDGDNNSPFELRLSPGNDGGTEGTLSIQDSN